MAKFGLSEYGFTRKTQADIEASIEGFIQQNYFPSFVVRDDSDTAQDQLIITFASELAEVWEMGEALYYAFIKSYATRNQLDNIGEYFNLIRLEGIKTVVTCTFTGVAGTVIPAGSIISMYGTSIKFETTEAITIPSGGTIDSDVVAQEYGPITVLSSTLTVIETPVAGWISVTNSSTQKISGRYEETDAEFRTRMDNLRSALGRGTIEAIKSGLFEVDNVDDVAVYENRESTTDLNGRPAKSFECIVYGGTDSDIAKKIWSVQPAGIESYGTTSVSIRDSENTEQTVKFTRPIEVSPYIDIEITKNNLYPADGDDQIKENIANYFADFKIGQHIILNRLYSLIYQVVGIDSVDKIEIEKNTSTGTSTENIVINYDEIVVINTDNISITYTA